MFVSRMTSSVIRDGEVALESLCAPVSLRVHVLLLICSPTTIDMFRSLAPNPWERSLWNTGKLIVKQLRVTATLLDSLALPLSSS